MKLVIHNSVNTFIDSQLSDRTKDAYRRDLTVFKAFIDSPVVDVDTARLIEYRNHLASRYAVASTNRMLSTVRSMYNWLHDQGIIAFNPSKAVKLLPQPNNATTKALSDAEARQMLEASKHNPKHHCILSMLLRLGLRRSELVGIRITDINTERDATVLTVKYGKGGKSRRVPIPLDLKAVVDKHICLTLKLHNRDAARAQDLRLHIFHQRNSSKPMHPESVRKLVKKYSKIIGVEGISPHSLRATATSNAIDQGCSFIELQYAMGWSSSEMVKRYDKRRSEVKNSAVWKIDYGVKNG